MFSPGVGSRDRDSEYKSANNRCFEYVRAGSVYRDSKPMSNEAHGPLSSSYVFLFGVHIKLVLFERSGEGGL